MKRTCHQTLLLLVFFLPLFLSPEPVSAQEGGAPVDILFLSNGDTMHGEIKKFSEGNVIFQSPTIGSMNIPWKEVRGIESSRILYFRLTGGNVLAAQPQGIEEGKMVLLTVIAGRQTYARQEVLMVGVDEDDVNPEYLKLKEDLGRYTDWSGYLKAGFSGNEGNQNDRTFLGGWQLKREASVDDLLDSFITQIDATYSSARRKTTNNAIEGFIKQALDISPRFYGFVKTYARWDEVQEINLDFRIHLGLGIHLIKPTAAEVANPTDQGLTRWDFDVAGTYRTVDFKDGVGQDDTHTGNVTITSNFEHIFTNAYKITLFGEYVQAVDPGKDYNLTGIVTLTIPIGAMFFGSTQFFFDMQIKDEYRNVVAEGKRHNDFYWNFALRYEF